MESRTNNEETIVIIIITLFRFKQEKIVIN